MKRITLISFLLALCLLLGAQVVFRTKVKPGPVVAGESFSVQYILEDRPGIEFFPPEFKEFRVVNEPYAYGGTTYGIDEPKKLKNIVFTLEALRPGKFKIEGARAKVDDRFIKSDDAILEVISRAEAIKRGLQSERRESNNAAYFLEPGEDPYRKIRNNLFLKVMVDKKTCFVGEPVTATFKLYSRLVSRSDIVKNPGFYGFTVQDIVGLNDKQSAIETINGKKFDVHMVRKVQLYPLQAGQFNIDPMEVVTKVDFSRSIVNKKTEQDIKEGIYPNEPEEPVKNIETFESSMNSGSVPITVKPSPAKNRPADFAGATGNFWITGSVNKNKFGKNEEGELVITVSGKGNFTQLTAPVVQWPDGIEGFDAQVKDELDHNQSPLKGTRTFRFPFVSAKPGNYIFPAISFSFFDPDSNSYKTVVTKDTAITISKEEKAAEKMTETKKESVGRNYSVFVITGLSALLVIIGVLLVWVRKRIKTAALKELLIAAPRRAAVTEILQPAILFSKADDKLFYTLLRSCIWNFFSIHFGLRGSSMNRQNLVAAMKQKQVDEKSQLAIAEILEQCETGMFADVDMEIDRKVLLGETTEVLEVISRYL